MNNYGLEDIPKGTIYPLLTAMQKRGLIEGKNKASAVGPTRKYYFITEDGQAAKKEFINEWYQLQQSVNLLVEEEDTRSEEHTSELQSRFDLVCRLLLEKKNKRQTTYS